MGTVSPDESFTLRWNDYSSNLKTAFLDLREKLDFCDVTLITIDGSLRAHQVILSACSDFFKDALHAIHSQTSTTLSQPAAIFVRGVKLRQLEAILEFIYQGEVNISNEQLSEFLSLAHDLKVVNIFFKEKQIKGLIGQNEGTKQTTQNIRPFSSEPSTSQARNDPMLMLAKALPNRIKGKRNITKKVSLVTSVANFLMTKNADNVDREQSLQMTKEEIPGDCETDEIFDIPDDFFQDDDQISMTEASETLGVDHSIDMQQGTDPMDYLTPIQNQGQVFYKCTVCCRQSNIRHNMRKHVYRMHLMPTRNPCSVCGKVFRNRFDLDSHQRFTKCKTLLPNAKKFSRSKPS